MENDESIFFDLSKNIMIFDLICDILQYKYANIVGSAWKGKHVGPNKYQATNYYYLIKKLKEKRVIESVNYQNIPAFIIPEENIPLLVKWLEGLNDMIDDWTTILNGNMGRVENIG